MLRHLLPIPTTEKNIVQVFDYCNMPEHFSSSYLSLMKERKGHHNLDHVFYMANLIVPFLSQIGECSVGDMGALILAIMFHDIEYTPGAKDNEIRSVEVFKSEFYHFMDKEDFDELFPRVSRLILESPHPKSSLETSNLLLDRDVLLMHDLDYAILGAPWYRYCAYSLGIAYEAREVVDYEIYRQKRIEFLTTTMSKPVFILH